MANREPTERVLAEGRHLRLVERNGWEFVERPGITGIVVVVGTTERGRAVLVSQWREAVGAPVIEWPAGLAGDEPGGRGEDLTAAARRELHEETGFEAGTMERLMDGPPSPGISNENITLFRARGLRRTARGGGVGGERIRTHVVAPARIECWLDRMRARGAVVDPKVPAGLWWLTREGDGP